MYLLLFLKSLILGILIVAPLGPVGALFIRYSLSRQFSALVLLAIGSSVADLLYVFLVLFSRHSFNLPYSLRILGGVTLIVIGTYEFFRKPVFSSSAHPPQKNTTPLWIGFFLTITNILTPVALVGLLEVFQLPLNEKGSNVMLVLGVSAGMGVWWSLLGAIISWLRSSFSEKGLLCIHRWISIFLIIAGLATLLSSCWQFVLS